MPPYIPPDYLDNTSQRNLADALQRLVCEWEQYQLDVASGYFEPGVWQQLRNAFPHLEGFRLLLGREPDLDGKGAPEEIDLRRYFRHRIQGELEELPFNPEYAALIDGLIAFLRRESVAVRLYPSFLHAKAYIFPDVAIVGSSNFTRAGLNRKAELNLVHKSSTVARDLRDNWFESFWQEAEEYKAPLIGELEASKFGKAHYTPFQVFIKALYEYFKERLGVEAIEQYGGIALASFQQEGLREAIQLLDRHYGVLIADAVGLGKTYIGMGLLEHYLLGKRRKGYIPRGLVVCPAQLRDLVWVPKLDEYGIKATVVSMEEMGRRDWEWRDYNHYDLVLVDESHNFRNPATGRYQNLNKLIATGRNNKYVILMTATPINNTIWDLYHQIMLLTRGRRHFYRDYGVPTLRGFFRRVVEGSAELFDLLEQTAVRRSRYDIRKRQEAGEEVVLPGKGVIHFPERELRAIQYNLERAYSGFYRLMAEQIENLGLVSYNIEQFHVARNEEEVNRNNALIGIMKTTFLKRLESSWKAFEVSLKRQQKYQRRFFDLLQEGRLLDSASHRKMMALRKMIDLEEDEERPEAIEEIVAELPEVSAEDYDLAAIKQCVEQDIHILQEMLEWLDLVREEAEGQAGHDAKLQEMKQELSGPLHGRKVLIFTYYKDTARYLYDALLRDEAWWNEAGQPTIELIDGDVDPRDRERRVRRFAPVASTPETPEGLRERQQLLEDELQILISTDVLSEGQNLQDAGVMINYDLHWNPVRMIQRAGRIDRLGTPYD
ncbi:MAG: phospholipase D-like domain-containing protein, partial [Chloroflexota bacterium]|nr:phospholipase D-like domain-containing protein [Chloroflexota bacterium]